jgi:low affinity Fe/Cu permease
MAQEGFTKFSRVSAAALGSPIAFIANCFLVLIWLGAGPIFGYSDTWQLLVNTVTTVLTFLAVFILQNSQNRDSKAIHIKLDELIRALHGARNTLVDIDDYSNAELQALEAQFKKLAERAHTERSSRTLPEKEPGA